MGDLEIDVAAHRVLVAGEEVHLTPTEWGLLKVLASNRGRLLTHRALLIEVWGPEYADDNHVLRGQIANLRRKIEPREGRRYIRTDAGIAGRLDGRAACRESVRGRV